MRLDGSRSLRSLRAMRSTPSIRWGSPYSTSITTLWGSVHEAVGQMVSVRSRRWPWIATFEVATFDPSAVTARIWRMSRTAPVPFDPPWDAAYSARFSTRSPVPMNVRRRQRGIQLLPVHCSNRSVMRSRSSAMSASE